MMTDLALEVPFLPEPDYQRLLEANAHCLAAVNFSLPILADARCAGPRPRVKEMVAGLARIGGPSRYLLLNARVHDPVLYDPQQLGTRFWEPLRPLMDAGVIEGIVWADAYLLQALGDAAPDLAARLEAVPSINLMPDRIGRIAALMEQVASAGFAQPAKLVLDRSLNRRPAALSRVAQQCRVHFPQLKLGLLANEGCLPHCPFKPAHDAQIAMTHLGLSPDTFRLNRDLGCLHQLAGAPWRIFRSPFLRPEDLASVAGTVDFIKLSGRTLGPVFLARATGAYLAGAFDGNLLDLLDAPSEMARRFRIDNGALPADLAVRLGACPPVCGDCDWCRRLHQRCARALPPDIPPMSA